MKTIDLTDAQAPLSRYAEELQERHEALVVVRDGKPVAALVALSEDDIDLEHIALSTNREFLAFLDEARRSSGEPLSHDEFWRQVEEEVGEKPGTAR